MHCIAKSHHAHMGAVHMSIFLHAVRWQWCLRQTAWSEAVATILQRTVGLAVNDSYLRDWWLQHDLSIVVSSLPTGLKKVRPL
jgi:hypothetical protein